MATTKYIHGFDKKEQQRLIDQALFLEPYVYQGIDLEFKRSLLEVGCGVGAQTKILCRRFPDLQIDGIDLSEAQLGTARNYLSDELRLGRVHIQQQDVLKLKLSKKYDSAFLCWFLEHVPDPLLALKQVRKQLKPGSTIYCSEVFNQALFVEPYSPAFLKYWFEFNDYQWTIKGHPFIGAQLGNLLSDAGYKDIKVELRPFHFDSREPDKKTAFIDFFFNIMLSADKVLLAEKRVTKDLIQQMKKEIQIVKKEKNSVFFFAYMRATAKA